MNQPRRQSTSEQCNASAHQTTPVRRPRFARRTGSTLVWFAMILFGLMGLAAIVIDMGMMRLTQRQMQTASRTAALEALSLRDSVDGTTFAGRTVTSDTQRRQAAADRVSAVFDDDFDTAADSRNFGAGPRVTLTGGVPLTGAFQAAQDLSIPDPPVYKPDMQLNTANVEQGDLVAGSVTGLHPEEVTLASEGNAMLARLRRSNETLAAGVGDTGGNVPYLFGRGTLLAPELRGRGVVVRAQSIADAKPVVHVGPRRTANGVQLPGAIPFAITQASWTALSPQTPTPVLISSATSGSLLSTLTEIGQTAILQNSPLVNTEGYCPIVADVGGSPVVIGFGWATLGTFDGTDLQITKRVDPSSPDGSVAPRNASARLSDVWNNIPPSIRSDVIQANRTFADPLRSPLLVH